MRFAFGLQLERPEFELLSDFLDLLRTALGVRGVGLEADGNQALLRIERHDVLAVVIHRPVPFAQIGARCLAGLGNHDAALRCDEVSGFDLQTIGAGRDSALVERDARGRV